MPPLLAVLQGTPLWVWGILVYLVAMGIYSLQPRVTSIYRLYALPAVFMIWALSSLAKNNSLNLATISAWGISFTIGNLIGFCILGRMARVARLDSAPNTIRIEGSYLPLILGLTFFAVKYCFGVAYDLHPELRMLTSFQIAETLTVGFITGISIGRFNRISKTLSHKLA